MALQRSMLVFLTLALAVTAQPGNAQPVGDNAEAMIRKQKAFFRVGGGEAACLRGSSGNDIVVCGRPTDVGPRYIPLPDPVRVAKPVMFTPPAKGVGVAVTIPLCFLQKCPKKLYFIDLKSIPEAPPGSDADKIGRGMMKDR